MVEPQVNFPCYQVVIIGGGIGGLALGSMLRKLNISFKILERSPSCMPAGAGISLAPNALHVLDQLGLYNAIKQHGQILKKIRIIRNSTLWRELDTTHFEDDFGYPVMSIERHLFHRILFDAAGGEETVSFGVTVEDVVDDAAKPYVMVQLAEGKQITCRTVVGADGIRSVTRRLLARNAGLKEENTIRFTGRVHFSGYTAPLEHLGEDEIGVSNWLLLDRGILTTWPCVDNRQWYIGVQPADPEKCKEIDRSVWASLSKEEIKQSYGMAFHPFADDHKFASIIDKSERVVASNVFQETDFPSMSGGRIALVGDAAHSMTSFFGQGACQAVEDATELANALQSVFYSSTASLSPGFEDIATAYQGYCASREPRARDLVNFSANYASLHTAVLPWGVGPIVRRLFYSYAPQWVMTYCIAWLYGYQPELKFGNALGWTEKGSGW